MELRVLINWSRDASGWAKCNHVWECVLSHFSHVWLFVTLWVIAHQVPLSMGFSRQEYSSRLPCPPPRDLPDPGVEPASLMSLSLADGFFTASPIWEAPNVATGVFFFQLINLFWMEDNYFTISWWILSYVNMNLNAEEECRRVRTRGMASTGHCWIWRWKGSGAKECRCFWRLRKAGKWILP